jgi:regulator of protease activity HflC (stomatin/prohibitin superfamily)
MADITKFLIIRHLRSDATTYVQHLRNGNVKRAGEGLAFWFRPRTAALSEVPLDDREQALLFHARTADFQDVTVQATVNYRVVDASVAAKRIDFGISPSTGQWNATPLEALGGLLTELAQQPALAQLSTMTMADALATGVKPVRDGVAEAMASDTRLSERGLAVTDVRVVAIRAEAELERALQAKTREHVQQEADRATFERRALAVENERAIAENELKNQIELARREEELVAQKGQNERLRATEQVAAERIAVEAKVESRRLHAEANANDIRLVGRAEAEAEEAKLAVYADLDQPTMLGLALRDLAQSLPAISNLTITPELVSPLLARLAGEDGSGAP